MAKVIEVFKNKHYGRGIKLYDGGQYAEAIIEFETVMDEAVGQECPERRLATFYMGEAYANLGRVHLRMNMLDRAEEELKLALLMHPDYADLHLTLAAVYYKQGDYEAADKSIRQALSINPQYARALIYRGLILLRTGNTNGLAEIATAVAIEPAYDGERYERAITFYGNGDFEGALTAFEDLAETDLDEIRNLLDRGVQLLENQAYTEALDALIEAVSICPHYADLRHYLGLCYAHRDMMEQAIEQFRRAIDINPAFIIAHMNLATSYLKVDKTELAVNQLHRVLELDPDNMAARQLLASLPTDA